MWGFGGFAFRCQHIQQASSGQTGWITDITHLISWYNTATFSQMIHFIGKSCLMRLQSEQMERKPVTCKHCSLSLFLLGKPPLLDWMAAAQHTLLQLTMSPPPPPSTTVQQLDPWGTLLASTPTHEAHYRARTQSTPLSNKQRRAEPACKSCQKSHSYTVSFHLPAGQPACVINQTQSHTMFAFEFVLG